MTVEKWKDIVGKIKDGFKVEDEGEEHFDEQGGVDIEFIIFEGPLGKMRLEFVSRPVVMDKKTTYSNRIGSETKVDYIYSADERTMKLVAYKWDEDQDNWIEIEAGMFAD